KSSQTTRIAFNEAFPWKITWVRVSARAKLCKSAKNRRRLQERVSAVVRRRRTMGEAATVSVTPGRHQRRLRNYLLDSHFQLKYSGYLVVIAVALSASL